MRANGVIGVWLLAAGRQWRFEAAGPEGRPDPLIMTVTVPVPAPVPQ